MTLFRFRNCINSAQHFLIYFPIPCYWYILILNWVLGRYKKILWRSLGLEPGGSIVLARELWVAQNVHEYRNLIERRVKTILQSHFESIYLSINFLINLSGIIPSFFFFLFFLITSHFKSQLWDWGTWLSKLVIKRFIVSRNWDTRSSWARFVGSNWEASLCYKWEDFQSIRNLKTQ